MLLLLLLLLTLLLPLLLLLLLLQGYGMSYHDLFLNPEVQARFRPAPGAAGPYGAEAADAPAERAFASHAW